MSVRVGASINAVIPYGRLAPTGSITMALQYTNYTATGAPAAADPDSIDITVYAPDGTTIQYTYPPPPPEDTTRFPIQRLFTGNYQLTVNVAGKPGRWYAVIITNDGGGPQGEVEWEVREAE